MLSFQKYTLPNTFKILIKNINHVPYSHDFEEVNLKKWWTSSMKNVLISDYFLLRTLFIKGKDSFVNDPMIISDIIQYDKIKECGHTKESFYKTLDLVTQDILEHYKFDKSTKEYFEYSKYINNKE